MGEVAILYLGGGMRKVQNVPLHISILSIFVVLIVALLGIVVSYNYRLNSEAAMLSADRLLDEISKSVFERTTRIFEPAFSIADQAVLLNGIGQLPDVHGHPIASSLIESLRANRSIMSLYMGYANGDFFMVSRFEDGDEAGRMRQGAPLSAQYNVQRITTRPDGKRVRILKFLGSDLRTVGSKVVKDVIYDPRLRPWYQMAVGMDRNMLTDLYVYAWSKEVGLTVARRFDGDAYGVFGVDIALTDVSQFLTGQRIGNGSRIAMFKNDGKLLAYSEAEDMVKEVVVDGKETVEAATILDLQEPAMGKFFHEFLKAGRQGFGRRLICVGDKEFLAKIEPMPERLGKDQFLGILVPLSEFTGPIVTARTESLIVSFVALLMFVPIIIYTSRRLSRPIRALSLEAAKIESFDLEGGVEIQSRITEIRDLTRAMGTMKSTLGSFGCFVPKALVERMIRMRIVPKLGGERKELTLFFSDIQDFTTISEGMPAEDLTRIVSDYFETLGAELHELGGTIDKYIGDAIMAFWNAPEPVPDHAERACLAALKCRLKTETISNTLAERSLPPLHTRIGLHTGEAIVGNVGSSDRMDYTAMGAAVNLASRLEGLNKHYGTGILVSGPTREQVGSDFVFRMVGRVLPKGALKPVSIYELRGLAGSLAALHPELAVKDSCMDYCRQWDKVSELYFRQDFEGAANLLREMSSPNGVDPAAQRLMERLNLYLHTPPGPDWDGVEVFNQK